MSQDLVSPSIAEVLRASGLDYEVLPCDPDLADTAVFCAHYDYPLEDSVNTILSRPRPGASASSPAPSSPTPAST